MLILLYAGMQVSKVLGFVLHIYYDIKTFHIVARASCTSPLKPFHTIYHTQYIHSCPFELPFGKALYFHVRRVLSRLKVCQRHEFDSIRLQCSNAQFSSKISCTGKETLDSFGNYAIRIVWIRTFYISTNSLRIPPL